MTIDEDHVCPSCNCKLSTLDRSPPHQAELHLDTYPPAEMMQVRRLNADQNEQLKHRDAMRSPHDEGVSDPADSGHCLVPESVVE
jgi:hypothetical protein